jgi:hypothetical protein
MSDYNSDDQPSFDKKPLIDRLLNFSTLLLGVFTGAELIAMSYTNINGGGSELLERHFANLLSSAIPFIVVGLIAKFRGNSWRALIMMD